MANSAMQEALKSGKVASVKAVISYFLKWIIPYAIIYLLFGDMVKLGILGIIGMIM